MSDHFSHVILRYSLTSSKLVLTQNLHTLVHGNADKQYVSPRKAPYTHYCRWSILTINVQDVQSSAVIMQSISFGQAFKEQGKPPSTLNITSFKISSDFFIIQQLEVKTFFSFFSTETTLSCFTMFESQ